MASLASLSQFLKPRKATDPTAVGGAMTNGGNFANATPDASAMTGFGATNPLLNGTAAAPPATPPVTPAATDSTHPFGAGINPPPPVAPAPVQPVQPTPPVLTGGQVPPSTPPPPPVGGAMTNGGVQANIHAGAHSIAPGASIGGGYGTGAGGYYTGFAQGTGASDGKVSPEQTAYIDSLRAAHGLPSMAETRAARETARNAPRMGENGQLQPRGFAPPVDPITGRPISWTPQKSTAPGQDYNGLLRQEAPALQSLIQTHEQKIAQLQGWITTGGGAGNPQEEAIYKQYIAQEQAQIDKINGALQLRSTIGPYLSYLPKMANGQDIDWQYMVTNPTWANNLPEEIKTALFGMHIGDYASKIVSGQ